MMQFGVLSTMYFVLQIISNITMVGHKESFMIQNTVE
jgi:hypothetical protein